MTETYILFEKRGRVGMITLNHPERLNALSEKLMQDLSKALDECEADSTIHCMLLMGSEKVFSAGANIKEMQSKTYGDVYLSDFITKGWEKISQCRKPLIAVVSGYALGGGCELAMMCDFIIASDTAKFGQPEVKIGTVPGAGATQRLPRAIGKAKAMDLCLTGRTMDAQEAERSGLVARIYPTETLLEETLKVAQTIANYSQPVLMMLKETVNRSFETSLSEGILFERRTLHAAFALQDQKEGMSAFLEKRKAVFGDK